jgi:hypothetical protein
MQKHDRPVGKLPLNGVHEGGKQKFLTMTLNVLHLYCPFSIPFITHVVSKEKEEKPKQQKW